MTFHVNWFLNNIPVWKKVLRKFKNRPNLQFLEVGCYEGQATHWLLTNILTHPSSKITVVDTFKGSIEHSKEQVKNLLKDFKENVSFNLSSNPEKSKVIIYEGFSQEVIRNFGTKSKFDFIYIDGSHIAKDVLEDALLCWRLLNKGGIMIFDDYGWRMYKNPLLRPDLAINSFLRVFHGQYKILNIGYQAAILKLGENVPMSKAVRRNKLFDSFSNVDEVQQLQLTVNNLSLDLKKIQSAKVYKVWQMFCKTRSKVKSMLTKNKSILLNKR